MEACPQRNISSKDSSDIAFRKYLAEEQYPNKHAETNDQKAYLDKIPLIWPFILATHDLASWTPQRMREVNNDCLGCNNLNRTLVQFALGLLNISERLINENNNFIINPAPMIALLQVSLPDPLVFIRDYFTIRNENVMMKLN